MEKIYPDSGVELNQFVAKNYDTIMNVMSLGKYHRFIKNAINDIPISGNDAVLDLGCGTGRNVCLMAKKISDKGEITGLDISNDMADQFHENCKKYKNTQFVNQRIDIPFDLNKKFDKIFISFVIHGFPHEIRKQVIENVKNHLKEGGVFYILDFAEFDMSKMPSHHRFVFKKIECKYAFDYIERDWKSILSEYDFGDFNEKLYIKNYVRLLSARKS